MVEVIEKLSEPIRLPAAADVVEGNIVTLAHDKTDIYCVISNSLHPFGIVIGPRDEWNMVSILCNMAILKVDMYNISETYDIGSLLYSNESGTLTGKKHHENSLLVGHVISPPETESGPMEINWI